IYPEIAVTLTWFDLATCRGDSDCVCIYKLAFGLATGQGDSEGVCVYKLAFGLATCQ
ncbi:hypothetical protein AVEN_83427-1, partial [Araneus ventricosus]